MAARKRARPAIEAVDHGVAEVVPSEPASFSAPETGPVLASDAASFPECGPATLNATTVAAACLAHGELALAAAALLPGLDADGRPASGLAATLIRMLMQDAPAPEALPGIPDDLVSAAVLRLGALMREQEAQIGRLQSMLERLL